MLPVTRQLQWQTVANWMGCVSSHVHTDQTASVGHSRGSCCHIDFLTMDEAMTR
jgi:hypothetical protein